MLKLREPIRLKNRTDFIKDYSLFESRLMGNYSLMGNDFGSEELLHLVTTPPEIYIAEGGTVTAAGQTFFESRHEETLNIINNVLNRILVSAKGELTYQDRTYITDVLYKLGIRDDKKFMSEVRRYIDQSRNEQRFLRLYQSEGADIHNESIRNELSSLRHEVLADRDETEPYRNELYLSNIIMNRLQTAQIYQTVASFSGDIYDTSVSSSEYAVTEQSISSQKLLRELVSERLSEYENELVFRNEAQAPEGEALGEVPPYRERIEDRLTERELLRERLTEERVRETRTEAGAFAEQRTERELQTELVLNLPMEPSREEEASAGEAVRQERAEPYAPLRERVPAPETEQAQASPSDIYTNEIVRELSERQSETERILERVPGTDERTEYRESELIYREEQAGKEPEVLAQPEAQEGSRIREGASGEPGVRETVREILSEEGIRESRTEAGLLTEQRTERELQRELENNIIRELRRETELSGNKLNEQAAEQLAAPMDREGGSLEEGQMPPTLERITANELIRELSEIQSESERLLQSSSVTDQRTEYRETELIHRTEPEGLEPEAISEAIAEALPQRTEGRGEAPSVRDTVREMLTEEGVRETRIETGTLTEQRTDREYQTELVYNTVSEPDKAKEALQRQTELRAGEVSVPAEGREVRTEAGQAAAPIEREYTNEVLRELSERQRESERLITTSAETELRTEYRETELIHRIEQADRQQEAEAQALEELRPVRHSYQYISNNIYERELSLGDIHNATVNEEINAAVLFDIVKNLYHSEFDNINSKSTSEVSFRNAFYNASENTLLRLSRMAGEEAVYNEFITESIPESVSPVSLSFYTEAGLEPEAFSEPVPLEGAPSLEQQLIEINERNLQNVERYEQMKQLFQSLNAPERAEGGVARTRKEALEAVMGGMELTQLIAEEESAGEQRREQIIREIEKLIPQETLQVFQMAQQAAAGQTAGPEAVRVLRSNLEEAAQEIQRFQERTSTPPPPEETVREYEESQLIHRRNETLTAEEIEELLNTVNRSRDRSINVSDQTVHTLEQRSEVRNIHTEARNRITQEQQDEIAALVARGIRSQVGAISEQVLNKLEKRLKSEKSRRGI